MMRFLRVIVAVFGFFLAGKVMAQSAVTITPGADAERFAGVLGKSVVELTQDLERQVNQLFQVANPRAFLQDFQNAQSFSTKGLGVDYASEATWVELGATLSLASNVDKAYRPSGSYTDPPIQGGGANFSLMGGLNLGIIGLSDVMLFGNWFKSGVNLGILKGDYRNWGLHGQVRLLGPGRGISPTKLLIRWGGIAITTGIDYSRLDLRFAQSKPSSFSLSKDVPITVTSDASNPLTFDLGQRTYSVPLEITTSLRLLTLFTLYGGLGFDFQLGGGADLDINMSAHLSGKAMGTSYPDLGRATIKVTDSVKPSGVQMREILGLQLNMAVFRLFTQVSFTGSSPLLTSVAIGARFAY